MMADSKLVTYLDSLAVWSPPANTVQAILADKGQYTHMLLAFWTQAGAVDVAKAWADPNTFPPDAIDSFHAAGIKVMVSAGGATETPITNNPNGGADYGRNAALFAKQHRLDGVDFDIEDTAAFLSGAATPWIVAAVQATKEAFPEAIISHAPQAPYFMTTYASNYLQIEEQVGNLIDFYNIQFYNQGDTAYATYDSLFLQADGWASGTAIQQIHASGIPLEKIVVGKPVAPQDATNTGYVAPDALAGFLQQGIAADLRPAGVMGWQWLSDKTQWNGTWSDSVSAPFTR